MSHTLFFPSFMRRTTALVMMLSLTGPLTAVHAADVRFAYVGDVTSDAYLGVKQAMAENNIQGAFLGLTFTVEHLEAGEMAAGDTSAVFVDGDPDTVRRIARNTPDTPVFNLTARETALRAECHPNLFHTIPSERMIEDALRQWRAKNPDVSVRPAAWTTKTDKYAAGQLTIRFERNQGKPMTDDAWAGWAAAKLVGDLIARTKETDPAVLTDRLFSDVNFDGQRGATMTFRETGQLRQPLWLVDDADELVGEAPVRGVVDTSDLDTLGLTECPK